MGAGYKVRAMVTHHVRGMAAAFRDFARAVIFGEEEDDEALSSGVQSVKQEAAERAVLMRAEPALALEWVRDWNGYVREAALEVMAEQRSQQALERIIERLNDWVPSVAARAQREFVAYLDAGRVDEIAAVLDDIVALLGKGRIDHRPLVALALTGLCSPAGRPSALAAFARWRARTARQYIGAVPEEDVGSMAPALLKHPDASVRCAVLLRAEACASLSGALLASGLADASSSVRATALRLFCRRPAVTAQQRREQCIDLLLDPSPGVRETAHFYAEREGVDVVAVYRAHVAATGELNAYQQEALLCEAKRWNLRDAVPLALALMGSERMRTRRAAYEVLVTLDDERQTRWVRTGLRDPAGKIRGAMVRLLRGNVTLSPAELEQALGEAISSRIVGTSVALAQLMGRWQRLVALLRLLPDDSDPAFEAAVFVLLQEWNRREFWFAARRTDVPCAAEIALALTRPRVQAYVRGLPHLHGGLVSIGLWPTNATDAE